MINHHHGCNDRMVVKSDTKWPVQRYQRATGKSQAPILTCGPSFYVITLRVNAHVLCVPVGVRLLHDALAEIHLEQV